MRIYFVIDCYFGPTGGTERQLQLLIRELVSQHFDVKLFVLRHSCFTESTPDFECPIECLDIASIASFATVRKMIAFRTRIKKDRPDVVHAFFNDSAVLIPLFCGDNTKVFTSRRDMGFWYTRAYLLALRAANTKVEKIICNCQAVAEYVALRERAAPSRLAVIYNACTIDDLRQPPSVRHKSTDSIHSDHSGHADVRVCLVANIRRIKRIEDLIKAAAIVHDQLPKVEFWIVGSQLDTSYYTELRTLTDRLGLSAVVRFLPPTNLPASIMSLCDIGVLSSQSEGLSNTIIEYMACGLPVLCSDVGGNPELVEHGRNGFRYPVGDISMMAEFLLKLCLESSLRRDMGRLGHERSARFSLEAMTRQHKALYEGQHR